MIEVLNDLATAFASTSLTLSADTLLARKLTVVEAEETLDIDELSSVAFGGNRKTDVSQVESLIVKHDPTYARGRSGETARLVATIALETQIDRKITISALRALTADFMGDRILRPEIITKAQFLAHSDAKHNRARPSTKLPSNNVKTLVTQSGEYDNAHLSTSVRSLARRLEEVIAVFDTRILLMDEEIDVLWWARQDEPSWTESDGVERVVAAALDLSNIIHRWPITTVTRRVLHDEISAGSDAEVELSSLLAVDPSIVEAIPLASSGATPILKILEVGRSFQGQPDVAQAILAKEGVDISRLVSPKDLADQLLREYAYSHLSK
ncbi:hypothetical protein HQQ82_13515 [Rathayibacter sp. VKM Ac-2856]|uniref:GTPase-associated system all-helical protein GASH n=1 Tax=unclassified Rathayibacter TaxID=2609250 RepID=UPI001563CBE4|nr:MULTISPECIES: GTPase-associated system all-helical protein GASH [unclassified Rathayibacter]NQX06053.1 hypothetical protein [Rathayibacter sp. VKM Ac-2858]NQX20997.1 hypothetical protein [Rathayibacter sp. VKM Ac-2856]